MEKLIPEIEGVPISWLRIKTRSEAHDYYYNKFGHGLPKETLEGIADDAFTKLILAKIQLKRLDHPILKLIS